MKVSAATALLAMRSTLLCILLCIGHTAIYGQQLVFFKPENLRQLPSSETYNVMQDSKGFIWFSTEAGLCRYNGDNLKVFDENAGLPEGATYFVTEDKKGTIWVETSKNRILRYNGHKFVETPFTRKVTGYLNKLHQIANYGWINDSILQVETQFDLTLRINVNSNEVVKLPMPPLNSTFYIELFENGSFIKRGPNGTPLATDMVIKRRLTAYIKKGDKEFRLTIPYDRKESLVWRYTSAINKKGDTWISVGYNLIRLGPDGSVNTYKVPGIVLTMKCDSDNGLWLGLLDNGLHYFPGSDLKNKVVNFNGSSVSGIAFDKEGGVWCTTLDKGVFYCRNKSVIDYSNREELAGKASFMKYINGHLFVSTRQDFLSEITKDTIIKHPMPRLWRGAVTDMIWSGKDWVFCSNHVLVRANPGFGSFKVVKIKRNGLWLNAGGRFLVKDSRSNVFGASFGVFFEVHENEQKVKILYTRSGIRSFAIVNDEVLAGCKDGLYRIRDTVMQKIEGIDSEIGCIMTSRNGVTWLLARNDGIYQLREGKIIAMGKELALKTKRFSDITEDRFGNMWLASNIGIVKLTPAKDGYQQTLYNSLSGLPANEIVRIAAADSMIYFSTIDGVGSFPIPEKLLNETRPVISIAGIKVNDKKLTCAPSLQLQYYENTVKVKLNAFTYRRAGAPPTIRYNLDGSDKDFQVLRSDELNLANLSPGKYHLKICAVNSDGLVSKDPAELYIEILPPFWKTTIFLISILIISLVLVYAAVRIITKGIRKREKEKTRINTMLAEYHMSALRAQMNPHFIFNCINSIQRYILTNQPKEAYNYLTKFSRLIRLVLNYAEKNLITLQQELEIVELYLELEQLRFSDKFTYTIRLDPETPAEKLFVPVLIIQPYVENAIWHGIMNLPQEGKGHIHITAGLENNVLIIKIEDNGVGQEVAARFSKKDHYSKSTWINKKRAEIINMEGAGMQNVLLEDILKEDGTVGGTRAIIRIRQIKTASYE